jgi:3-hydroxyisobutyrate dehydrogenase-like beta-hydroxyacid dehydrogenase
VSLSTVAILSPGDMGAAIGAVLRAAGLSVITCLDERGELTHRRAEEAGIRDASSLDGLVRGADLILSVLVPSEAAGVAERLAASIRRTGARPAVADCNAVAPSTVQRMAGLLGEAGATFMDAGIIGPPPRPGRAATRIYCSGPDCGSLLALNQHGLDVRLVGPEIGQASGLKMVYAASTKGTTALWTELLVAARALGLDEALAAEFALGRSDTPARLMSAIPSMPRRARRWVGEMEEIAKTFADAGLTPRMLLGAADMYRLTGETALANQTSREPDPPLERVIEALAEHVARGERDRPAAD